MSSLILTAAAARLAALSRSPERFAQLPENILLTISCWSKITFNIWQGSKNMWKICLLKLQLESCSATFCFGLLLPIRLQLIYLFIYLLYSLYNTNSTRIFFIFRLFIITLPAFFFLFFDYLDFKRQTPNKRDVVVSIINLILDGILQGLLGEQLKSLCFCELLRKLAKMQFWGASEA